VEIGFLEGGFVNNRNHHDNTACQTRFFKLKWLLICYRNVNAKYIKKSKSPISFSVPYLKKLEKTALFQEIMLDFSLK